MSSKSDETTQAGPRFTKGPWKITGLFDADGWKIRPDAQGQIIAVVKDQASRQAGQSEANARLIAASPEMYEALKDWVLPVAEKLHRGVAVSATDAAFLLKVCREALAKVDGAQ